MLQGQVVRVRPIKADDLDRLYERVIDLESRGPWYPLPERSSVAFRRSFEEHGYWTPDAGWFLIVAPDGSVVGQVDWTRLNGDIPDIELGYRTYDEADRGKGYVSDAVRVMTRWLFDTQPINRVRLTVHVDNTASRRVAEKCGFTHEATARGAWPSRGRWHDVDVFTVTRAESERLDAPPA